MRLRPEQLGQPTERLAAQVVQLPEPVAPHAVAEAEQRVPLGAGPDVGDAPAVAHDLDRRGHVRGEPLRGRRQPGGQIGIALAPEIGDREAGLRAGGLDRLGGAEDVEEGAHFAVARNLRAVLTIAATPIGSAASSTSNLGWWLP